MPSQRKRIGFLPRSEVHNKIEQICKQNKLSQSKVTGILVEEALNYRGVLNCSTEKLTSDLLCSEDNSQGISKETYDTKSNIGDNCISSDELDIKEEIKMINDFIEFKFFKKIINRNKNNY